MQEPYLHMWSYHWGQATSPEGPKDNQGGRVCPWEVGKGG